MGAEGLGRTACRLHCCVVDRLVAQTHFIGGADNKLKRKPSLLVHSFQPAVVFLSLFYSPAVKLLRCNATYVPDTMSTYG